MGFKHVGKKVETSDFRVDKDLFLERTKATTDGKMNIALVSITGKLIPSFTAIATQALADDNDAITNANLIGGMLTITPTGNRTKQLPTGTNLTSAFSFETTYQFADVSIINLASATHKLTLSSAADTTSVGSLDILAATSGLFRFVNQGSNSITVYRIA